MAERVEILVVATDSASQILRGVTSQFGQLGTAIQAITGGRVLEELTSQVVRFGKESVDATVKYANEVRGLMLISGEGAESTSRFLQVLDDYKLTAQDAMVATRALTKEGLTPNLQTLAKLSDEYLSINDKQKQNEFILKNLGRAGLQWVDVLNKGSTALLAQGDAIDESLILTQKAVDDARRYEIALDNWQDSVQGLKIAIGSGLLPVLTDLTNAINSSQRATEILTEKNSRAQIGSVEWAEAIQQATDEQRASTEAMVANTDATGENTAAKELFIQTNENLVSSIATVAAQNQAYSATVLTLTTEHTDLLAEKDKLISQGYSLEGSKIAEVNKKLDENQTKMNENKKAHKDWTNAKIGDMMLQRLSIGGLDDAETAYYLAYMTNAGLMTAEDARMTLSMVSSADARVAAFENEQIGIEDTEQKLYTLMERYQRALNQSLIPVNYTYSITGTGSFPNAPGHQDFVLSGGGGGEGGGVLGGRASGGNVSAGEMYRVNETRVEYFQPSMSGTVIPLGPGGGNGSNGFTFIYSPMVSLGDRNEFQSKMLPAIIEGVRKAKADGII